MKANSNLDFKRFFMNEANETATLFYKTARNVDRLIISFLRMFGGQNKRYYFKDEHLLAATSNKYISAKGVELFYSETQEDYSFRIIAVSYNKEYIMNKEEFYTNDLLYILSIISREIEEEIGEEK